MKFLRSLVGRFPGALPAARAIRRMPDRLLHPIRRRRAQRAIAALGPLRKVVVLCVGNINRSPYAAALLRARLGAGAPEVVSAGFIGPDRPSPPEAIAIAAQRGVDLSGHRSQLVTPDILQGSALVLVMNPRQRRAVLSDQAFPEPRRVIILGDLDPSPVMRREIRDPYDQARSVYEASFDRIERCVEVVARSLQGME